MYSFLRSFAILAVISDWFPCPPSQTTSSRRTDSETIIWLNLSLYIQQLRPREGPWPSQFAQPDQSQEPWLSEAQPLVSASAPNCLWPGLPNRVHKASQAKAGQGGLWLPDQGHAQLNGNGQSPGFVGKGQVLVWLGHRLPPWTSSLLASVSPLCRWRNWTRWSLQVQQLGVLTKEKVPILKLKIQNNDLPSCSGNGVEDWPWDEVERVWRDIWRDSNSTNSEGPASEIKYSILEVTNVTVHWPELVTQPHLITNWPESAIITCVQKVGVSERFSEQHQWHPEHSLQNSIHQPQLEGHSPPDGNGAVDWINCNSWTTSTPHPCVLQIPINQGGGNFRNQPLACSLPGVETLGVVCQFCFPGAGKNHLLAISPWKLSPWAGICFSGTECAKPRKEQSEFTFLHRHTEHTLSSSAVDIWAA